MCISAQVVVASRAVTSTLARRAVVDLTVTTLRRTTFVFAEILGTTFGGGPRKTPDVVALIVTRTGVVAPRATTHRSDGCVAPLTAARLTLPSREWASNPLALERRQFAGDPCRWRTTPTPAWFTGGR